MVPVYPVHPRVYGLDGDVMPSILRLIVGKAIMAVYYYIIHTIHVYYMSYYTCICIAYIINRLNHIVYMI